MLKWKYIDFSGTKQIKYKNKATPNGRTTKNSSNCNKDDIKSNLTIHDLTLLFRFWLNFFCLFIRLFAFHSFLLFSSIWFNFFNFIAFVVCLKVYFYRIAVCFTLSMYIYIQLNCSFFRLLFFSSLFFCIE